MKAAQPIVLSVIAVLTFGLLGLNVYAIVEPSPVKYEDNTFTVDKDEYRINETIEYSFTFCLKRELTYDINPRLINVEESIVYDLPIFARHRTAGCHNVKSSPRFIPTGIIVPGTYKLAFIIKADGLFKTHTINAETEEFRIDAEPAELIENGFNPNNFVRPRAILVTPTPTPTPTPSQSQPVVEVNIENQASRNNETTATTTEQSTEKEKDQTEPTPTPTPQQPTPTPEPCKPILGVIPCAT